MSAPRSSPATAATHGSASPFDPATARADFPALDQSVNGEPLVYLDNAATTQKPVAVLDALERYYREDNANVHRGIHELSRRATEAYEGARQRVADSLNAASASEIVWTRGTTESINLVASGWGMDHLELGDEILLSVLEHHSNIVPWQLIARHTGARIRYIEIDEDGEWILDDLPELLSDRTKVVALNHVSNALGTINPVEVVIAEVRVRAPEAIVLLDGAQAVAHLNVDVQALGADFYAFSGHKVCGPTGIGGLWGRTERLEEMEPWQGGGEMISVVEREMSTWAALPHKFEAGTPNIAGAVGMGAAIEYVDRIGKAAILEHERTIVAHAIARLESEFGEQIRIWGPKAMERRSGVVSFSLDFAHPHDIATILDGEGIAVRAGHHCAQLVMKRYGVAATARASFYLYNTIEEVDRLVGALGEVRKIFG